MTQQMLALFRSRLLLLYLVRANIKVTYKNKVLGYLWSLLDPLMLMVVYVILVQVIFKRGSSQFPVLLFSALLGWRWFQYSVQKATMSITGKEKLIRTVSFARIVLPVEPVLSGLIRYILSLGALIPMLILFDANFSFHMLWLPVVITIQFSFTLGCALVFAVVGSYFRDLENILIFGLRMWFYLSPALFSVEERIPPYLRTAYMVLNPFASLFTSYKNILVLGQAPSCHVLVTLGYGIVATCFGLWLFNRYDDRIVKDL